MRPQTTVSPTSEAHPVTITLPIHPYAGIPLRVLRRLRGSVHAQSPAYVVLEDPQGRALQVPVEWTDCGVPAPLPSALTTVTAAAPQLLALAALVEDLLGHAARPSQAARATIGHDASSTAQPPSALLASPAAHDPPSTGLAARDGRPGRGAPRRRGARR